LGLFPPKKKRGKTWHLSVNVWLWRTKCR
jgi:hypothetical protein